MPTPEPTPTSRPGPRLRKAPGIYLNQIPGYTAALRSARTTEFRTREDNWLAMAGKIAGCPVRMMTVRDYVALLRRHSPFVLRREPTFEDLGELLWFLSPQIERWHNRAGWRQPWLVGCRWSWFSIERWQIRLFSKRLRRRLGVNGIEQMAHRFARENPGKYFEVPEDHPLSRAVIEAFAYMDRVFFDKPVGIVQNGEGSGLHYLASWFDALQSEYKKTDEEVWRMPLPQLFARLKAIDHRRNPRGPDFNTQQDAIRANLMRALNTEKLTRAEILSGKIKLN